MCNPTDIKSFSISRFVVLFDMTVLVRRPFDLILMQYWKYHFPKINVQFLNSVDKKLDECYGIADIYLNALMKVVFVKKWFIYSWVDELLIINSTM